MRSDTIRMAKEAGGILYNQGPVAFFPEELERLAALVRADEREKCAKVCMEIADDNAPYGTLAYNCADDIRALKDE